MTVPTYHGGCSVPRRRLLCARYATCLDAAYTRGWPSWSCVGCRCREELTAAQRAEEAYALLAVWQAAEEVGEG